MLLELDAGPNEVFYAAPLLHTVRELNKAYSEGVVSDQSFYIRPSKIGKLDCEAHYVAFDAKRSWVCSDPREAQGISGSQFPATLENRLNGDERRFGDQPLTEALDVVGRILEDRGLSVRDHAASTEPPVDPRLQRLADISLQFFGAQLFVVQRWAARG
jgi:hypothetical protein